ATASAAARMGVVQRTAATPAAPLDTTIVLCIENEPQVLDGMKTLLGGWGCHVLAASDLASALATMHDRRQRPDVLLVDYHLDEGNGIDAIAALRAALSDTSPAALITADRSPQVREQARSQGIQVMHKPLKPAALRA